MKTVRIVSVVGARPNFMKVAPIVRRINRHNASGSGNGVRFEHVLVHTGQHYDTKMSDVFFRDLGLPQADINLEVGSGSHAEQTGQVMIAFEEIVLRLKPHLVIVVGDVNSTVACALASAKVNTPVGHVEAGLRSFDRAMPEEINRIVTDHVSSYLFTPSRTADANLAKEGIDGDRVFFVGNVMVDTLMAFRRRASVRGVLQKLKLTKRGYALMTLHRPSNVDSPRSLRRILKALEQIQRTLPVVFPVHPRALSAMSSGWAVRLLSRMPAFLVVDPLGYLDFLCLMNSAGVVLTDSGGVQEETTVLSVPCVTLRENTERPETVTQGTNVLVGSDPEKIVGEVHKAMNGGVPQGRIPELWDGKSAERVVKTLANLFA
jgi:UDP-N-acetylglucosamine 2-epimerase (non-hydrolysing)